MRTFSGFIPPKYSENIFLLPNRPASSAYKQKTSRTHNLLICSWISSSVFWVSNLYFSYNFSYIRPTNSPALLEISTSFWILLCSTFIKNWSLWYSFPKFFNNILSAGAEGLFISQTKNSEKLQVIIHLALSLNATFPLYRIACSYGVNIWPSDCLYAFLKSIPILFCSIRTCFDGIIASIKLVCFNATGFSNSI